MREGYLRSLAASHKSYLPLARVLSWAKKLLRYYWTQNAEEPPDSWVFAVLIPWAAQEKTEHVGHPALTRPRAHLKFKVRESRCFSSQRPDSHCSHPPDLPILLHGAIPHLGALDQTPGNLPQSLCSFLLFSGSVGPACGASERNQNTSTSHNLPCQQPVPSGQHILPWLSPQAFITGLSTSTRSLSMSYRKKMPKTIHWILNSWWPRWVSLHSILPLSFPQGGQDTQSVFPVFK